MVVRQFLKLPFMHSVRNCLIQKGMSAQNIDVLYGAIFPDRKSHNNCSRNPYLSRERWIADRLKFEWMKFRILGEQHVAFNIPREQFLLGCLKFIASQPLYIAGSIRGSL